MAMTFLEKIKNVKALQNLTLEHPFVYFTLEIYREDIRGAGGLGILAADTLDTAHKLDLPYIFLTPFYPDVAYQAIVEENGKYKQFVGHRQDTPIAQGFGKTETTVTVLTQNGSETQEHTFEVYQKTEGSVKLLTLFREDFGELYNDGASSDTRLFQEMVLGIGGQQLLTKENITPSVYQLNEAATVFAVIAYLDRLLEQGIAFAEALEIVKRNTLYTNHSLVQAAEPEVTLDQFERIIFPNLSNEELQKWLRSFFSHENNQIKLSTLCLSLAGQMNGVSLFHAQKASESYKDKDNKAVNFIGITNGIALEKWIAPELQKYYEDMKVIDECSQPGENFRDAIENLDLQELISIKQKGKKLLANYLLTRKDHRGNPVTLPTSAKVLSWRRRIAAYKRPDFIFSNIERLVGLLEKGDIHILLAGRAHPLDFNMQAYLTTLFDKINQHPVLSHRVHFIQDYDIPLARYITYGADIAVNVPRVGEEACGTSWEKDVMSNTILIATPDGGIRDPQVMAENKNEIYTPSYLEVTGSTEAEELESLYINIDTATDLISDTTKWDKYIKKQLTEFLPIISPARMMEEYLKAIFK